MREELRALLEERGAVFQEVAGREVVRRYGDVAAEYRAVRRGAGVAVREDRARVRLWGKDPVRMVQGLVTNDLAGAPEGRAVYAAMLTPKGRTVAELRALRLQRPGGTEVLLDVPREALAGTTDHLRKFVPPMFAKWGDASDEVGCVGVYGPGARDAVERALGAEIPALEEDAFREVEAEGEPVVVLGTRDVGGEEGFDLLAPMDLLPRLWTALTGAGAVPVGHAALETLRVEAGRPRYGAELTEEVIPTEAFEATGLIPRAISFTKGCYTGQEVIIRIAHRGHVNRHLRGLRLGDSPAPPCGTPLHHPETGRTVGITGTAAASPLLAETIALAFVRRELEPGATVRVGATDGPAALVTALPFERKGADG